MDLSKAEFAIEKAGAGLYKYLGIMRRLHNVDVSNIKKIDLVLWQMR